MKGENDFVKAVEYGNVAELKRLIDAGATVNFAIDRDELLNVTSLMIAAEKGDVEVIDFLLKAGADVKAKDRHVMPGEGGETALFYAVRGGHEKPIRALVRARSSLNAKACGSNSAPILTPPIVISAHASDGCRAKRVARNLQIASRS